MKKIAFFFLIVIVIVVFISYLYLNYRINYNQIKQENNYFESYLDKEIYGTELTTIINKAIDKNTQNNIEKDNKGFYIDNKINSINIDVKMLDNDKIYKMETFFNGKMKNFVQYYGDVKFKCQRIEYHKNTEKIRYIFFEQMKDLN